MMNYTGSTETDVGGKPGNEDSLLWQRAITPCGEAAIAVVCDGMGGLAHGEVASATVVRVFARWFQEELPRELPTLSMKRVGKSWVRRLEEVGERLYESGERSGERMGTTFSGLLLVDKEYLLVHVGDSRIYHMGLTLQQMTEDHTLAAREAQRGTLTAREARSDSSRSVLLQSVGASRTLAPQVVAGRASAGVYLLCSDGLYHELTEKELRTALRSKGLPDRDSLKVKARELIELDKARGERDNISAILIRVRSGRVEAGAFRILEQELVVHTDETE